MAFDPNDEILQDFLVEGGEILEQLSEQLVDLEQRPTDADLLNAVFRGFHTIKGGASFISLSGLVDVCHVAEDVFNSLRQGERKVDSLLMDVMLRVLDALHEMFDCLRGGKEPALADPALIAQLKALQAGTYQGDVALAEPLPDDTVPTESVTLELPPSDEEITDDEFERLLDELDAHNDNKGTQPPLVSTDDSKSTVKESTRQTSLVNSDEITDDEFELLLDELHEKGTPTPVPTPSVPVLNEAHREPESAQQLPTTESAPISDTASVVPEMSGTGQGDDISEVEFDHLLDQIHGKGKMSLKSASTTVPPAAQKTTSDASVNEVVATPLKSVVDDKSLVPLKPVENSTPVEKNKPVKEPTSQGETTVRVDTKRLDDIMNMVGELVLVRNRLMTLESALGNEEIAHAIANLDLVTADLQASVMKTRMQPIKKVFGRFPRVVRDLARSLKKEVNLELQGEETDLDKNLVEALADPLVHLVRNAVDHGIEMPSVREQGGKSRTGLIVLAAEQEGDHILLTISDDGGGMDPDVLRRKAVEKGLMDEDTAERLDNRECFNLIFSPGFSTKTEISDISGRGVGMDVVKTRIVQLNGSVEIDSVKDVGTRLTIKVPLTLAIMPTLMVKLATQIFALPLTSVSEIFNLELSQTNVVDGQLMIMLRDKPLPLYFLADWLLHMGHGNTGAGHVVVVAVGNQRVGFVVEHLIGQEEVVIKPLGAMLQGTQGMAGATITGDGRIALILDVPSLVKCYASHG